MGLKKTKKDLRIYLKNTWKVQHVTGKVEILVGERYIYKNKWYIDKWENGIRPNWVKRFNEYHEKIFKPQTNWDSYITMKSEKEIEMYYGSGYFHQFKCKYAYLFGFRVGRIMPVYMINGVIADVNIYNKHQRPNQENS